MSLSLVACGAPRPRSGIEVRKVTAPGRFREAAGVNTWGKIPSKPHRRLATTDLSWSACGAKNDVTKNNGERGRRDIQSSFSLSKNGLRRGRSVRPGRWPTMSLPLWVLFGALCQFPAGWQFGRWIYRIGSLPAKVDAQEGNVFQRPPTWRYRVLKTALRLRPRRALSSASGQKCHISKS